MSNSLVTSVSPEDLAAIAPGQAHAGIAKALGYAGKSDVQQMYVDFELFAKNALLRNAHIAEYGFVLLTLECLDALASRLHELTCLEVGAGTGYLSYHLAQRNINVTASEQFVEANRYGFRKLWKNDHEGNSLVLLPGNYDVVLMSWPPSTGNFACEVLTSMSTGQVLVYQGEEQGGRTIK